MDSMSIYNWLKVINLQQYTSNFLKAGYSNSTQCGSLTEKELHTIGVTLPGHIRRILAHPPQKMADDFNELRESSTAPTLPPKAQSSRSKTTLNQLDRITSAKPTPKPRRTIAKRSEKASVTSDSGNVNDVPASPSPVFPATVAPATVLPAATNKDSITNVNITSTSKATVACLTSVDNNTSAHVSLPVSKFNVVKSNTKSNDNDDSIISLADFKIQPGFCDNRTVKENLDDNYTSGSTNTYHEYENDDEFKNLNKIFNMSDSYNENDDECVLDNMNVKACSNDYHDYINELEVTRSMEQGFSSSSDSTSQHQLSSPSDTTNVEHRTDTEPESQSPDYDPCIYEAVWQFQTLPSSTESVNNVTPAVSNLSASDSPILSPSDTDNSRDSYYYLPPPTFAPPPLPQPTDVLPALPPRNHTLPTPVHTTDPITITTEAIFSYTTTATVDTSTDNASKPIYSPVSDKKITSTVNTLTSPVMSKSMFGSCSEENPFADADPFADFTAECAQFNNGGNSSTNQYPLTSGLTQDFDDIINKIRSKEYTLPTLTESVDVSSFDPLLQSSTTITDSLSTDDVFDPFNIHRSSVKSIPPQPVDNNTPRASIASNTSTLLVDLDMIPTPPPPPVTNLKMHHDYVNDKIQEDDPDDQDTVYYNEPVTDDIYENSEYFDHRGGSQRLRQIAAAQAQPASLDSVPPSPLTGRGDELDAASKDVPKTLGAEASRMSPGPPGSNNRIPILAGAPSTRVKERSGYIFKQGGFQGNKGWRKRWVVFNGEDLRYYTENKSYVSKRVIPLTNFENIESDIKVDDHKRFKFKLICKTRVYIFGAETLTDNQLWTQTLMEAIITYRRMNPMGEVPEGGKMGSPDIEGYVKFDGVKNRSYMAIKKDILCYYRCKEDYDIGCPIHEIPMQLAGVKQLSKNRLQLSTHYQHFYLTFDTPQQMVQFKMGMEDAIAEGLADDTVLTQVRVNDSNHYCVDCRAPNPHWAAINYGVVLCTKCAGIHRMFSQSRIRSLRMDTKVWTTSLVTIMFTIGNGHANELLEFDMTGDHEIDPDTPEKTRQQHLENKYRHRRYLRPHELTSDKTALNEELLRSAQGHDILNTLHLILCGAEVMYHRSSSDTRTAYALAKETGQVLQMELLLHNGGDGSLKVRNSLFQEVKVRTSVSLQGYLYKNVTTNFKDNLKASGITFQGIKNVITTPDTLQRQWVVLEHGILSCFFDEKSGTAKDLVDCDKFCAIFAAESERHEFSMQVCCTVPNSKPLVFATEMACDRVTWMQALAKSFCPIPLMEIVGSCEFAMAGFFHVRDGLTGRSSTLEDQQLTSKNIPIIVDKCISFIDMHGKQSEGIYRRSGTHSKVTNLLEVFKTDARTVGLVPENSTDHDVANVLKRYFRSLDDPLLTRSLYMDWIEKAAFSDHNTKLQWYKYLLCQLPKINYDTLKRLIGHLASISDNEPENLMGISQLAAIFGPTLMTVDTDEVVQSTIMSGNTGREITVLTDIITSHQWLFEVDETETEKDRMIDDAAKKLRNLVERNDVGAQDGLVTMIDVYVDNRQGECITLKQVMADTTVAQILKRVCTTARLQETSCAIYEVACSDNLERPLVAYALIQDVILEWQNWADEDRRTVYLCVKSGDLVQFIHSLYDFHAPLFGEIKFSEKKSYKKFCIEFKQYKLTCYKDSKATNKVWDWEVERLSVYSGVEKRRNPPTEHGFTFIVKGEKLKRSRDTPYFGKSVCCSTQEETMNWLSGIYKALYPNGFHSAVADPSK